MQILLLIMAGINLCLWVAAYLIINKIREQNEVSYESINIINTEIRGVRIALQDSTEFFKEDHLKKIETIAKSLARMNPTPKSPQKIASQK